MMDDFARRSPPSEQLLSLLAAFLRSDSDKSTPEQQLELLLPTLASTRILALVYTASVSPAHEDHAAAQTALHRWTVRINSLMAGRTEASKSTGVWLACVTSAQAPEVAVAEARGWVSWAAGALTRPGSTPSYARPILVLLADHLLPLASSRPEYTREVLSPIVVKLSASVSSLCEREVAQGPGMDSTLLHAGLQYVRVALRIFPTLHRPLVDRIQHLCTTTIFAPLIDAPTLSSNVVLAGEVLSALHLTGASSKGNVNTPGTAAAIWSRTLQATFGTIAKTCHDALWTTFVKPNGFPSFTTHFDLAPLSASGVEEPYKVMSLAFDRLEKASIVLNVLLRTGTPAPVSIPIASMVALINSMLSVTASSQGLELADRSQHVLERAFLPRIHLISLSILGHLSNCLKGHLSPYLPSLLPTLVRVHEDHRTAPLLRLAILRTLAHLLAEAGAFLDPAEPSLSHTARLCLEELATTAISLKQASAGPTTTARSTEHKRPQAKRTKTFETDEAFSQRARLDPAQIDTAQAALQLLGRLLPVLVDPIETLQAELDALTMPLLLDLAHHLLIRQTTQAHVRAEAALAASVLTALDDALHTSSTAVLATASGAAVEVARSALHCTDAGVRRAARDLTGRLERLLHPRFPPLVSARGSTVIETVGVTGVAPSIARSATGDIDRGDGGGVKGTLSVQADVVDMTGVTPSIAPLAGGDARREDAERAEETPSMIHVDTSSTAVLAEKKDAAIIEPVAGPSMALSAAADVGRGDGGGLEGAPSSMVQVDARSTAAFAGKNDAANDDGDDDEEMPDIDIGDSDEAEDADEEP